MTRRERSLDEAITGMFRRLLRLRPLLPAVALAAFALFPFYEDSGFRLRIFTIIFLNGTLAMGLSMSLGFTGLFNLSQGTFYGVGAYATAILMTDYGVPFLPAAAAATFAAAIAGVLLGVTFLRTRGDYLALISFAFTVAAVQMASNLEITGGKEGFTGIPTVGFLGLDIDSPERFYYMGLVLVVICYVALQRVAHSFAGRAMLAVRYDESAATMMGVNAPYYKLLSMAVGSAVAGLAGAFFTATSLYISPGSFDILPAFNIVIWVIVGGLASIAGAFIAAATLTFVEEEYRELANYRILILGSVMLFSVMLRGGVIGHLAKTLVSKIPRGPN